MDVSVVLEKLGHPSHNFRFIFSSFLTLSLAALKVSQIKPSSTLFLPLATLNVFQYPFFFLRDSNIFIPRQVFHSILQARNTRLNLRWRRVVRVQGQLAQTHDLSSFPCGRSLRCWRDRFDRLRRHRGNKAGLMQMSADMYNGRSIFFLGAIYLSDWGYDDHCRNSVRHSYFTLLAQTPRECAPLMLSYLR